MKLGTHMPDGGRRKPIDGLFLELVNLTFVLQTSISIGFLLSPSGMCVLRFF
jgi:hypothetical protein